jgi:hypothetical protein
LIARVENHQIRWSELCALAGGVLLLVALIAPLGWIKNVDSGGLTGQGCGRGTVRLTATEILGLWLIPVIIAALTPIAEFGLRISGRSITPAVRLIAVVVGLGVLAIGVTSEVGWASVDPDACYWQSTGLVGLIVGGIGSALLLIWIVAGWSSMRQR